MQKKYVIKLIFLFRLASCLTIFIREIFSQLFIWIFQAIEMRMPEIHKWYWYDSTQSETWSVEVVFNIFFNFVKWSIEVSN